MKNTCKPPSRPYSIGPCRRQCSWPWWGWRWCWWWPQGAARRKRGPAVLCGPPTCSSHQQMRIKDNLCFGSSWPFENGDPGCGQEKVDHQNCQEGLGQDWRAVYQSWQWMYIRYISRLNPTCPPLSWGRTPWCWWSCWLTARQLSGSISRMPSLNNANCQPLCSVSSKLLTGWRYSGHVLVWGFKDWAWSSWHGSHCHHRHQAQGGSNKQTRNQHVTRYPSHWLGSVEAR